MLDYLATVMAFVGAIVALPGENWNKKRRGLRRLTATGWIALTLIMGSLPVQICTVHRQTEELEAKAAFETTARNLAILRLLHSLRLMLVPIESAVIKALDGDHDFLKKFSYKYDLFELGLDRFSPDVVSRLDTVWFDRQVYPLVSPLVALDACWRDFFCVLTTTALKEQDRVLAEYTSVLPSTVLLSVERLRAERYLVEVEMFAYSHDARNELLQGNGSVGKELGPSIRTFLDGCNDLVSRLHSEYSATDTPPDLADRIASLR